MRCSLEKKNLRQSVFKILLVICGCLWSSESYYVSPRGYFIGDSEHVTDWELAKALVEFFHQEGMQSVVDFGCADGDYVNYFLKNGFQAVGYDGNPVTELASGGSCFVKDLSLPFDLNRRFDWVMSLETGEHIPPEYESVFIRNLMRHATKGIVLSWAIKGQGGIGHFNEQDNDYIKQIFEKYGWKNDPISEMALRMRVGVRWFEHSLMVFRK